MCYCLQYALPRFLPYRNPPGFVRPYCREPFPFLYLNNYQYLVACYAIWLIRNFAQYVYRLISYAHVLLLSPSPYTFTPRPVIYDIHHYSIVTAVPLTQCVYLLVCYVRMVIQSLVTTIPPTPIRSPPGLSRTKFHGSRNPFYSSDGV